MSKKREVDPMIAKPRVLVIDDEPGVIRSCDRVLTREGIEVEGATSSRGGLELFESNGFDAVLLDLKMPDLNGIEVLKRLKWTRPEATVIIITGYPSVDTAVEALKLGAFDYVPKPFTPDEITEKVRRALKIHESLRATEPAPTPGVKVRPLRIAPEIKKELTRVPLEQGRCIKIITRHRERIAIIGLNGTFHTDSALFSVVRKSFKRARAPITIEYGNHEVQGKEILSYLEDHDKVIVLARVVIGEAPGTVRKFGAAESIKKTWVPRIELPQIGFPHIAAWAEAIGVKSDLVVIAVEPDREDDSCRIDEDVQRRLLTEMWREIY